MASLSTRNKRVERAQTRVIFTCPFFAPGVAKLPVVFDEGVQTACTDGSKILWGPKFFDGLTDPQLVTVLVHETAHCLLGHSWRAPEGVDWEQWNIACDHAVNLMLKDFSADVMRKGVADPFPFPEPADAYCADERFKGMAEEAIYKALGIRPKAPGGSSGGSRKPQGGSGGVQIPSGSGKWQGGAGKGQGGPSQQAGSMPSFGQFSKPSRDTVKKLDSDWANTLIQSAKLAQGQGSLPGSLQRLVDETIHPAVPWWEILRSWLREQSADDWDFQQPALEYEASGFMLPSLHSEQMGSVVFGWDRSGSIDSALDARMASEAQSCLDQMRPRKIIVMPFDTRVTAIREYLPGETIDTRSDGGGGTDFRDLFVKCAEMSEPPKCVVVLTDLFGTFPDTDPGVPTIFVTWTKGKQAPFGETVYAGEN